MNYLTIYDIINEYCVLNIRKNHIKKLEKILKYMLCYDIDFIETKKFTILIEDDIYFILDHKEDILTTNKKIEI